jgi:hypothetical protein
VTSNHRSSLFANESVHAAATRIERAGSKLLDDGGLSIRWDK